MRYLLIAIAFIIASCTGYQKVVKNGTPEEKLEAAKKYYNKKDYARAEPLFDELMTLYFGKPEREDVFFYLAYTHYGQGHFYTAGYRFMEFTKTYPTSANKEEAYYMSAVCEYHNALSYELDQHNTELAISRLQAFINLYPNSEYIEDCNKKIDELRLRILTKVYHAAKLYYQLEQYKPAIVACENAIKDYPDIVHRDELMYLIVESSYLYAFNSVTSEQLERYKAAKKSADEFLSEFKEDNPYHEKVTDLKNKITKNIEQLENTKK